MTNPEQVGYPENISDKGDNVLQLGATDCDENIKTTGATQIRPRNLSQQLTHLSISSRGGLSGSY